MDGQIGALTPTSANIWCQMNSIVGLPISGYAILLALLAFLVADEGGSVMRALTARAIATSDRSDVRGRLAELGKSEAAHYENFRIFQLSIALTLILLSWTLLFLGLIPATTAILFSVLLPFAALILTNRALTKRVHRKRLAIESEFPAIVEMLTLAIGSGASPTAAMSRIARRADGFLARDFRQVITQVESGVPFHLALDEMSRKAKSVTLRRFVDSMIISITRGAPLVEVLSHGAQEARNSERIKLLDKAGKSEIAMMIPVVFLILPISILFALFPSLSSLDLFNS
jgi:tight adherence protein C